MVAKLLFYIYLVFVLLRYHMCPLLAAEVRNFFSVGFASLLNSANPVEHPFLRTPIKYWLAFRKRWGRLIKLWVEIEASKLILCCEVVEHLSCIAAAVGNRDQPHEGPSNRSRFWQTSFGMPPRAVPILSCLILCLPALADGDWIHAASCIIGFTSPGFICRFSSSRRGKAHRYASQTRNLQCALWFASIRLLQPRSSDNRFISRHPIPHGATASMLERAGSLLNIYQSSNLTATHFQDLQTRLYLGALQPRLGCRRRGGIRWWNASARFLQGL